MPSPWWHAESAPMFELNWFFVLLEIECGKINDNKSFAD